MSELYSFLARTTDTLIHGLTDDQRQAAYHSDITYGTNNEFGFDYLRDNMKYELDRLVQRGLHYAIIDEVDSIQIGRASCRGGMKVGGEERVGRRRRSRRSK